MMMNLFSSFDPSTNWNTSINWSSSLLGMMVIPSTFWLFPSRMLTMWNKMMSTINKELSNILSKNSKKHSIMMISIMSFILLNNTMGMLPYVFTSSSHMVFSLSMALPMWMSFMLFGWMKKSTHMLAHLVPQGTPSILMPFMVCIETISNIIRPGTLAIRLSANMIAGHLLMTLLGNTGSSINSISLNILIIMQLALITLEMAVAMIQSYVFTVLLTLYSSEIN